MKKVIATILGVILIGTLATGCGSSESASCPTDQWVGQDGQCHESNSKSVVVAYDIEDASWGDEQWELDSNKEFPEDAWLAYGPSFKVTLSPWTKFECDWTALDMNGVIVGTLTGVTYNTGNHGSTIPYPPYSTWYIEANEEIVKSVETFDVSCWR